MSVALVASGGTIGCDSGNGGGTAVIEAGRDAGADAGSMSTQGDGGSDAGAMELDGGQDASPAGDAATDAAATGDASVSCTPGEARCVEDRAEVCASTGDAYNGVDCSNGCDAGECEPLSLETGWMVHQFDLVNDPEDTEASYSFENDGLVAVQSANPMASVYYNERSLPENVVVTGRFSVTTTQDDDLIGFVFGWSDPEHFYLFDWKQADQNGPTCGMAHSGASLKVANADAEIDDCNDVWATEGTDRVMPLIAADADAAGWEDNVEYELRLVFKPGDIRITITNAESGEEVVSLTSDDTTYRSGSFGFYNYSQESVRYEFFSISPVQ